MRGEQRSVLKLLGEFDFAILGAVLTLSALSLIILSNISAALGEQPYFLRQIIWICFGLIALVIAVSFDYSAIARFSRILYGASIMALLWLLVFGKTVAGAKSWIVFGAMSFQPSEIAKIFSVLLASAYLAEEEERQIFTFKKFIFLSLIFGAPSLLTALQPDLGTALSFLPMFAISMYLGGASWRWFAVMALIFAILAPIAWFAALKDYQKERILTLVDPMRDPQGSGYQILQSKIAIGSGGLAGRGLQEMTQSQLRFIPAQHTDFVFSAYAESMGFLGVCAAFLCYGFILFRILNTAAVAKDALGFFIATGVFTLAAFQSFLNLGMVVGFFPITGLPLPWMSYGGSAMVTFMVALGLVLNVKMRRFVN